MVMSFLCDCTRNCGFYHVTNCHETALRDPCTHWSSSENWNKDNPWLDTQHFSDLIYRSSTIYGPGCLPRFQLWELGWDWIGWGLYTEILIDVSRANTRGLQLKGFAPSTHPSPAAKYSRRSLPVINCHPSTDGVVVCVLPSYQLSKAQGTGKWLHRA